MKQHFIPIWFFIGALLAFYGLLILGSGIYSLFVRPPVTIAMAKLHIDIWWGAGMLVLGFLYILRFWPKRLESASLSEITKESRACETMK